MEKIELKCDSLFCAYKNMILKHETKYDGYMIKRGKLTCICLPDVELNPSEYDERIECFYHFYKKDAMKITERYNIILIER